MHSTSSHTYTQHPLCSTSPHKVEKRKKENLTPRNPTAKPLRTPPFLSSPQPQAPPTSPPFGLNGFPASLTPFRLLKNCAPSTNLLSLFDLPLTKSG